MTPWPNEEIPTSDEVWQYVYVGNTNTGRSNRLYFLQNVIDALANDSVAIAMDTRDGLDPTIVNMQNFSSLRLGVQLAYLDNGIAVSDDFGPSPSTTTGSTATASSSATPSATGRVYHAVYSVTSATRSNSQGFSSDSQTLQTLTNSNSLCLHTVNEGIQNPDSSAGVRVTYRPCDLSLPQQNFFIRSFTPEDTQGIYDAYAKSVSSDMAAASSTVEALVSYGQGYLTSSASASITARNYSSAFGWNSMGHSFALINKVVGTATDVSGTPTYNVLTYNGKSSAVVADDSPTLSDATLRFFDRPVAGSSNNWGKFEIAPFSNPSSPFGGYYVTYCPVDPVTSGPKDLYGRNAQYLVIGLWDNQNFLGCLSSSPDKGMSYQSNCTLTDMSLYWWPEMGYTTSADSLVSATQNLANKGMLSCNSVVNSWGAVQTATVPASGIAAKTTSSAPATSTAPSS